MLFFSLCLCLCLCDTLRAQQTPFEQQGKNYSASYQECMDYYRMLDRKFSGIQIKEMGRTDAGIPLHLILLNSNGIFNPEQWHQQQETVILINNGIHSGEPDGIDASMMLTRDILISMQQDRFPENVSLAIIPAYNIGGVLNRSPYYRVDQNGPEEFGSRGNSQNLDLNRDFIKCDSRESRSFAELFHFIQPDIFLDNHVSDGADYPYIMTLAPTQKDKLGGVLGQYLYKQMEPELFSMMKQKGFPMIPYANFWGSDAKDGWSQFFDSPRYSSGYAALFNTLSFVPETHMLKPYADRVQATYTLMQTFIQYASSHNDEIIRLRKKAMDDLMKQSSFPLTWSLNKNEFDSLEYQGYEYDDTLSGVSGLRVKHYNRNKPYSMNIRFSNVFQPNASVIAPLAYVIPQGWYKVIELLALNGIDMTIIDKDTSIMVEAYRIKKYTSTSVPYEGHHPNQDVELDQEWRMMKFRAGDVLISTQQRGKRFLVETLEPQGMDSYFLWNFFDPILNQKEGFTAYNFEKEAAIYLREHPEWKDSLTIKSSLDTGFAHSAYQQLDYIYRNSPYYEPQHNLYPVYRITEACLQLQNKKKEQGKVNKEDE